MLNRKNRNKTVAFIFARGGSKGLPRKNLLNLDGKPLIAHSIVSGLACPDIDDLIVSTDDTEIASVALKFGAKVPFLRPDYLATDTAAEWDAWQHAISWYQRNCGDFDIFLTLPPTSPLRNTSDIQRCLDAIKYRNDVDVVITVVESSRSPYFNMVKLTSDNMASLLINQETFVRRQDAPKTFDITTVAYAAKPSFILKEKSLFDGRVIAVKVPPERAVDIDTEFDLRIAETMLTSRAN